MKANRTFRAALWLASACVVLLSGCASYVSTQVTAFSDWSGSDATRTYAFTRDQDEQNSLEQATYENIVANELSTLAFRRVPAAQARYLVALTYGIKGDLVNVPQPVYYDPWIGPGPYWRGAGAWGGFGPWGPFPAGYVNQTYRVYERSLTIRITERGTGREVYNVSARNSGGGGSLVTAMPYLARSALADFPLGNGSTRTVRLPVDRNGGGPAAPASNERAVPAAPSSGASPAAAAK
ncbi:DUF4136 domain-containing protein, partial [Burkholderia gladioli]|uniref:DUF4136 domain-containing protein n=3 Tax=Burkholderia gladioli TaxID=28095 RepID=UPI00064A6333|nr:DUF4136 domain-containing protein [Burkholderia gladioli]MDA0571061.1 DUF4136 domain-containing protein [Burkholderia gladioli]MDA0599047.1 DUF4136 domain-containing protein [Burkholderia gladioli]